MRTTDHCLPVILTVSVAVACGTVEPAGNQDAERSEAAKRETRVDAASIDLTTTFELSGGRKTPRYRETVEYCRALASASDQIRFTSFGRSPLGRELPLLIIDRRGNFTPEAVRASGNAVVLIEGAIHAGEVCGKDAGLMLARDLTSGGELSELLEHLTVLFIPIFNVDGHERFGPHNRINQNGPEEMGWRTNANNLDLNRDFLKADTKEMRAWLALYRAWLPEVFIDIHSTDGADYQYPISYGMETHGDADEELVEWNRAYLEQLGPAMLEAGFLLTPYVAFKDWHDPRSGLMTGVAGPRYSNGYTTVQNRVGLLIETHMLKDYATRVAATYEMLKLTLAHLGRDHRRLRELVREADLRTASAAFRKKPFHLRYEVTEQSEEIDFLGVEYEVVKSDLTGGEWFKYGDTPRTFKIRHFDAVEPIISVKLPEAYVIPPQWGEVIERLELHGVELRRLSEETRIEVRSYRFSDVQWKPERSWHTLPYEGRHLCEYEMEELRQDRVFPKGSAIVDMQQRLARLVAHFLEPAGFDSAVHWGFFGPIFQRTEYVESYVIEEMARKMIAEDPSLKDELERQKKEAPEALATPQQIRRWFYERTPYYDNRVNLYPVGLIDSRRAVGALPVVQ